MFYIIFKYFRVILLTISKNGISVTFGNKEGEKPMRPIHEVMLNPTRMRIIQEFNSQNTLTSTDLCQKILDVPRTTIYRHINVLLEHKLLVVVSEKKVRGSTERTLALNLGEFQKHNTLENASENALKFLLEKFGRFQSYFSATNPNPSEDKIWLIRISGGQ